MKENVCVVIFSSTSTDLTGTSSEPEEPLEVSGPQETQEHDRPSLPGSAQDGKYDLRLCTTDEKPFHNCYTD